MKKDTKNKKNSPGKKTALNNVALILHAKIYQTSRQKSLKSGLFTTCNILHIIF